MKLTDKTDGPEWLAYGKERLGYDTEELFAFALFKERNVLRYRIAELEKMYPLLIKIRDELLADENPSEAYHLLYMFAEGMAKDPYKPWIELEEAARAHDKGDNPLEEPC